MIMPLKRFENKKDYIECISDVNLPILPWENTASLQEVLKGLINEVQLKYKEISSFHKYS